MSSLLISTRPSPVLAGSPARGLLNLLVLRASLVPREPRIRIAVATMTILLATSACGSEPEEAVATDQQPTTQADAAAPRDFPGANGEIAAIDGRTLQVQSPMTGQVAVTWTDATTFTAQVAASAADLAVGSCVMVQGEGEDTVAAASVRITPATDGSCEPSGGGPRVQLDGDARPAAPPSGVPGRVMMGGAFGRVSTVSDTGFTVETTMPGEESPTTRQVTTSAATTWTTTRETDSAALAVGKCVVAQGDKDDTGAVTAKTVAVSDKVEGSCLGGMVRRTEGQP